jgi:hypothetical protein
MDFAGLKLLGTEAKHSFSIVSKVIFNYSDVERLYNGDDTPEGLTITSHVWWDTN